MSQLSLFNSRGFYEFPKDLLEYQENFLNRGEADILEGRLLNTVLRERHSKKMYYKSVIIKRLTAWYGDDRKSTSQQYASNLTPY